MGSDTLRSRGGTIGETRRLQLASLAFLLPWEKHGRRARGAAGRCVQRTSSPASLLWLRLSAHGTRARMPSCSGGRCTSLSVRSYHTHTERIAAITGGWTHQGLRRRCRERERAKHLHRACGGGDAPLPVLSLVVKILIDLVALLHTHEIAPYIRQRDFAGGWKSNN